MRKGITYVVTGANVAPHHFPEGARVKFVQTSRAGDRHLFRGNGIQQWLAAEDVEEEK